MRASPALVLHLPPSLSPADRDQLVALLAEHQLVAIQENDVFAPSEWIVHFADAEARASAAEAIAEFPGPEPVHADPIEVADGDWARRTQADLPAIRIGRIVVAPPWDIPNVPATDLLVRIEPSRGFGTGHHQSTRLCLVLLQQQEVRDRTMIDVGTGSGVLAIAAAKLGAAYVAAIDVDPDAIENARENIAANAVGSLVEAHVADFTTARLAPADLVTANLTGSLLARHADDLAPVVKVGGRLIVSGFNVDEREMVAAAFDHQFQMGDSAEEEGWWAFALVKQS